MPAAVAATDLSRSFGGRPALDGLTLEVGVGEVVALLGPNGAGKTTTVRLLNGVLRPDRGASRVLGLDPVTEGHEVRRRTGVVTESAGLDDRLSARQNLAAALAIRGVPGPEADRLIRDGLERFGLAGRADRPLRGASTGERRRVALARALLHRPEVLFLDEPTSGLDPAATREVVDLITELAADGCAVLLCTHFLMEAGQLAGRIAVLDRGVLRAFGPPAGLAADLWPGLAADVDLGRPASPAVLAAIRGCPGVIEVAPAEDGARLRVSDRAVLAAVVATLVAREVAVFAAVPRPATVEDVYFALQGRAGAAPAGRP